MTTEHTDSNALQLPTRRLTIDLDRQHMVSTMFTLMQRKLGPDAARWETWMWKVADWLIDNHGRGLLLYGLPGTGKTFMAEVIIKTILEHEHSFNLNLVTRNMLNDMGKPIETWGNKVLDDVGHEAPMSKFGDAYRFDRIIEEATRRRQLLIITTNLYPRNLRHHYGLRTYDRLKLLKGIHCDGGSKRGFTKVTR